MAWRNLVRVGEWIWGRVDGGCVPAAAVLLLSSR